MGHTANIKAKRGIQWLSLLMMMASFPAAAQEMETPRVSQNNVVDDQGNVSPLAFYPGMSCARLNEFSDDDFNALHPIKDKGLLSQFCETEPLYTCSDYEAYLPEGFHLEPQGHGAFCKLQIRKQAAPYHR